MELNDHIVISAVNELVKCIMMTGVAYNYTVRDNGVIYLLPYKERDLEVGPDGQDRMMKHCTDMANMGVTVTIATSAYVPDR